jgi:hypothetical protein
MSQVIYARVPDTLKEAVDIYATERGTTLTSAVVDLIERGLMATSDAPSVGDLEQKLATIAAEKLEAEASLKSARIELQTIQLLAKRAGQTVGSCPREDCSSPITGQDLLVTGHCPSCNGPLNQLLKLKSPQLDGDSGHARPGGLSERDFLLLLGALGVVVGAAAYAASKS